MQSFDFKQTVLLPSFLPRHPVVVFFTYLIIWEFLYLLMGLPNFLAPPKPDWESYIFNYVWLGIVNYLLFYIMAFVIIPYFFIRKKKIAWLIVICLAIAALFTLLKHRIEVWHFKQLLEQARKNMQAGNNFFMPLGPSKFGNYLRNFIWFNCIIIIIAFAYQLLLTWYRQEKVRKDLENQKLQAELSFLKMQVNPHFLFNALNNIYSMAVLEKSNKTGDGIMKLSELIRYMLYEKEDEQYRVSLDKEIKHINSFIDLQKLRHDGDIYLQFSIEGDTTDKKVPSLLLFPLIENSCKHGILQDPEKPAVIQLQVTDRHLFFSIYNFKNKFLKDGTGGIGLNNVRKRLWLLYDGKYNLNIKETSEDFLAELQLPL